VDERQGPEDAYEGYWVIAEPYVDMWKLLPMDTGFGLGVLVFECSFTARWFIEANWESLGPSWVPKKLFPAVLAYALERFASEEDAKWVVYDAPPIDTSMGGEADIKLAEIGEFIGTLRS
jgi:hypothetical protein